MDSLVQDGGNFGVLAMELLQSCSKPSNMNIFMYNWCASSVLTIRVRNMQKSHHNIVPLHK